QRVYKLFKCLFRVAKRWKLKTEGSNMSKNESQLLTKTKRLFIAMLALFPWLLACADDARPPKPPFLVPFEAQKAGSVFTTELRVVDHRQYEFALLLKLKKGATMEDANRLLELAGGI